ncbi:ATP synthase mitochondrial F1 complex assembly factor 1 isoform X1 [Parasteatoda tepidariorum]|uniref:ATP synthase mitochondrial F1 complex assembly factor 1 isoform X1 n=1 Tax=Parasteatoda tepidariorum TaxID=114398 RepID=UPI001C71DC6F|nr:ATP synthase mitochondrial F1 complex assembly factor 1 isoform X2 [Parasteatoda tepidariorum]
MNIPNFKLNSVKLSQYLYMNTFRPVDMLQSFSQNLFCTQSSVKNPYLEKYAAKIIEAKKKAKKDSKFLSGEVHNLANVKPSSSKYNWETKHADNKKSNGKSNFQKEKDLNLIMKLDAIKEKSAQEIESIWKEYHKLKHGVYTVLPAKLFEKISSNLKNFPIFLFPLPRTDGYEFIMCQFLDQSCYFTSLINYQTFKENAPICLTVTYFTELMNEKDIVLMRGEYDNSIQTHEAQCLVNQLQLYYGSQDEKICTLLSKFNNQPDTFNHIDLISAFESTFQTGLINS